MYRWLFDTVFRRISPERAHQLAMVVIRAAGLSPIASVLRRRSVPDASLAVQTLGLSFDTPFGIAAGFDKNAVAVRGLGALGFGHVEIGTVTNHPQPGNPRPRLFRLPADRALVNRMGFNNAGAARAADRLRSLGGASGLPVVGANIGKSRIVDVDRATEDYVASATVLAPLADYLAVNVSSPNTPGLRTLQAVETLRPLLEAVRAAADETPLLVKIAPDLDDDEVRALARLAVSVGLDGLIATNTTISRDGLSTPAAEVAEMGPGGLSGPVLAERSLAVLALVREVVPEDFCVISVGGVETAHDVQRRLDAGATLVQGYTAFIYRGPLWASQINAGLRRIRRSRA